MPMPQATPAASAFTNVHTFVRLGIGTPQSADARTSCQAAIWRTLSHARPPAALASVRPSVYAPGFRW
jgi:hypothetical protein